MKTAVIGAGLGGLSLAARMAAQGVQVDLYDTEAQFGGKAGVFKGDSGLVWDMGPTLLTLPLEVQRLLTQHASAKVAPPPLLQVQEGTHVIFSNVGLGVSESGDWKIPAAFPNAAKEIPRFFERQFPQDGAQVSVLLKMAREVYAFGREKILGREPPSTAELAALSVVSGFAFKYPGLVHQNYRQLIERSLSHPQLREFFLHFASYVGIQPELASASLISLAHVELVENVVFPQGGMGKLADFLFLAGCTRGVQYIPDARVVELAPVGATDVKNKGWRLQAEIKGKVTHQQTYEKVVVACDPHQALLDWLQSPTLRSRWLIDVLENKLRPAESQFVIFFEKTCDTLLSHHTKFFPKSFSQSYREVAVENRIPNDPCVYLVWPHATDKTYPKESLFVSAMAPQLDSGDSWSTEFCKSYAEKVVRLVQQRGLPLEGQVVGWRSPMDFYRKTGSLRGSIYGATVTRQQLAHFSRPGVPPVPNLYFVGGGVHPGAGVPMVLLGAERVFASLARDLRLG